MRRAPPLTLSVFTLVLSAVGTDTARFRWSGMPAAAEGRPQGPMPCRCAIRPASDVGAGEIHKKNVLTVSPTRPGR
jgi:hypothetical protein